MGKWKGIREQVKKNSNPALKLYDLTNDPGETTDLAALHPNIVLKIENIMLAEHRENKFFPLLTSN